ncbi:MAG TPA: VOC family protein [Gemmatimonadales bacterium]|jgi:glyoxylase I family protein|nr:VOC family protein [Gemmatimonadales bacterium]
MELRIFSREGAERYEPQGVEICISISDPSMPAARLSPRFAAVLRLGFSDIVAVESSADVLFAAAHAGAIVAFVERWRHAERLVVHCHAGVSRSPAVALGLCDRHGWPAAGLEEDYPYWNRWVRQVLVGHRDEMDAAKEDKMAAPTTQPIALGLWGVRYQVRDVQRSIAFYTETLGFHLDQQYLPAFGQVSIGDLKLILSGPGASGSRPMPDGGRQEPGGWNRVILEVKDLPARIAELKRQAVRLRNEMEVGPGGKQVQLEDPDGNPIELFEPAGGAAR